MRFLEEIRRIGDDALVEWDSLAINYEERAAQATPMWFAAHMSVCRRVKYRNGREVPYVTVNGCEIAAWVDSRWVVRGFSEDMGGFWQRVMS